MNNTLTKETLYLKHEGYTLKESYKIINAWKKFNYRKAKLKKDVINKKDIDFIEFILNKNQNNGNKNQKLLIRWL